MSKFIWFEGWVGTLFLVFESHPDIHDHILENNPTRQESYDVPDSKKNENHGYDMISCAIRRPYTLALHSFNEWVVVIIRRSLDSNLPLYLFFECVSSPVSEKESFSLKKTIDRLFKVYCDCNSISVLRERQAEWAREERDRTT